jgi:hypothetical protein
MSRRPAVRATRYIGSAAAVALLVAGTLSFSNPSDRAQAATAAMTPVSLVGEGTWDTLAEQSEWDADVSSDTAGGINLSQYFPTGDKQGIDDLVTGAVDYAISGVPPQPSQLAQLPGGASGLISVPIMPSGLQFMLNPPSGGFEVFDANGNGTYYGTELGNGTAQPGGAVTDCASGCPPINVPAVNLLSMFDSSTAQADAGTLAIDGDTSASTDQVDGVKLTNGQVGLKSWGQLIGLWDTQGLGYDDTAGDTYSAGFSFPSVSVRSDPNDEYYYLQQWAVAEQSLRPTLPWGDSTTLESELESAPLSESLPRGAVFGSEASGLEPVLGQNFVGQSVTDNDSGSAGDDGVGDVLTLTPPSGEADLTLAEKADQTKVATPPTGWPFAEPIEIQNANGDWVAPTPTGIDNAIDAGAKAGKSACDTSNNVALYTMDSGAAEPSTSTFSSGAAALSSATFGGGAKVPGAYPLSWVDCMYVPSSGLSVAKTDAIAGTIRYLVTDGQARTGPFGDGTLPPEYVTQAIAQANLVVTDNCAAAGGQVVLTSEASPYEPTDAGVIALGPQDECEATATTPGSTTTSPPTTSKSSTSTPTTSVPKTTSTTPATNSSTTSSIPSTTTTLVHPGGNSSSGTGQGTGGSSNGSGKSAGGANEGGNSGSGGTSSGGVNSSTGAGASAAPAPAGAPSSAPTTAAGTPSPKTNTGKPHRVELSASFASNLPEPLGIASQNVDKLSALLLGGALFLLGRRSLRWLRRATRE